ncbi:entericidin EcnA/B family protein [Neisseria sp. HMSC06F02]|jgi:entericidin ecnAB|nr:entericidin EcnA/B family protein [Neisseria sp. HMSC06F02]
MIMKKFVLIAMTAMTLLSACNTISGMGKDVKAAGNAVSNTAEKDKTY